MSYHSWHVGMKVVCISEPDSKGYDHERPKVGRIYTLRMIGASAYNGDVVVRLNEIRNNERRYQSKKLGGTVFGEICFGANHFRPVQARKTDISIFTAILNGARVPEGV